MVSKLFGLVTLPLSLAMKLVRLPFTIMGCISKLGCLLVVFGIPVGLIVLVINLT